MNWITHFAVHEDPVNGKAWRELMTPKATGLILKSIEVDYKFVTTPITYLWQFASYLPGVALRPRISFSRSYAVSPDSLTIP